MEFEQAAVPMENYGIFVLVEKNVRFLNSSGRENTSGL